MMDDREIVDILKQIRDEAKQTNARISELSGKVEQTNARVGELSGGIEALSDRLDRYVDRLHELADRQTESELRLSTEVIPLADVTRQVRDLLATKLDDHHMVLNHEERLRSIESRIDDSD